MSRLCSELLAEQGCQEATPSARAMVAWRAARAQKAQGAKAAKRAACLAVESGQLVETTHGLEAMSGSAHGVVGLAIVSDMRAPTAGATFASLPLGTLVAGLPEMPSSSGSEHALADELCRTGSGNVMSMRLLVEDSGPKACAHTEHVKGGVGGCDLRPPRLSGVHPRSCAQWSLLLSLGVWGLPLLGASATSEKMSTHLKAERHLVKERGGKWASLQSPCEIHNLAIAQTKAFSGMAEFVSNMAHLGLSLRMSGRMKRFRACLRKVVLLKLLLLPGQSSAVARAHREFVLKLFLSRATFAAKKRAALWVSCSGDWRREGVIEHHVDLSRTEAERK